jgi:APA family basic amino acid/polyamine antiporter
MSGGSIMGGMIALLLISSISSMIFAGPRVTQTMGEDVPLFRRLAMKNSRGVPSYAVILQSTITVFLILTATFESVVKYIAFTLDIFTCLTVIGVFVMRFRKPDAERKYAAWGYPVTPILFLIPTVWTMVVLLRHNTTGSLIALGTVLAGLIVYFLDKAIYKDRGQAAR